MQRQSATFPEIPRDRPPLRRSSPSSPGIGEPGRSRTALSPGPPGGGLQTALEKNVLSEARLQPPGRSLGALADLSRAGGPGEPKEPTSLCAVLGALSGAVFRLGP